MFRLSDNSIGSPFKPPDVPGEEVEKVWVSLVVDHCWPSVSSGGKVQSAGDQTLKLPRKKL